MVWYRILVTVTAKYDDDRSQADLGGCSKVEYFVRIGIDAVDTEGPA